MLLAVLTAIKIFPALFFPYLLIKRQWKAAAAYITTSLALWAVTVPVFGISGLYSFWQYPMSDLVAGNINYAYTSISFYGTYRNMVRSGLFTFIASKKELVAFGGVFFSVLSVVALLGLGYLIWKHRHAITKWQYLLDYTSILITLFLFSKQVHGGYLFWLLPMLLVLLAHIQKQRLWWSVGVLFVLYFTQFWDALPWLHHALLNRSHTLGVLVLGIGVVLMQLPKFQRTPFGKAVSTALGESSKV